MVPTDPKAHAAWIYDAAAGQYDDPALSFWERFGRRTVERLELRPGARVLDACCGTGASALHAADQVGPRGQVIGIDLSEGMLQRARTKAAARGLHHASFHVADIENPGLPEESFDAAVCVFGIFFVPDMQAAVRALWRLVRPGGALAVTTWGPGVFEPADGAFWQAVLQEREDLCRAFAPWDRVNTPELLRALVAEGAAGAAAIHVEQEAGAHPLASPEAWWSIVMGSGYRGTVEQLDAAARERVRATVSKRLIQERVTRITADVLYAVARKEAS
jgi:ubiquinone/menaquinone biosynthesis C-methylase UbiE